MFYIFITIGHHGYKMFFKVIEFHHVWTFTLNLSVNFLMIIALCIIIITSYQN